MINLLEPLNRCVFVFPDLRSGNVALAWPGLYLVGHAPGVVLQRELWQRQFWPGVKRVFSVMIVALLKERVVSGLERTSAFKYE